MGVVALLLALPVAWSLGRGRGWLASALWLVLPICLLMPSLVIAYGWKQVLRLAGAEFEPKALGDVARCIWSLATWLWPVPAIVIGMALRRSDSQIQQQALLDGALLRVMLRQLAGPIIASTAIVSLLAMQEFAVYEPTGISVVATEVRMVFETGAYSSPANPIVQPMGSNTGALSPDQPARAAAAVATAMPLFLLILVLALIGWLGTRRMSAAEHVEIGVWPRGLDAPGFVVALGWLVVLIALAAPIGALGLSLKRSFDVVRIWNEFYPQLTGSIITALATGIIALILCLAASPRPSRGLLTFAVLSFLVGGQMLAIALIRVYNRPWLTWVYNGLPIIVMAYIGRFGWIALGAAAVTWSGSWRQLRQLAAIDGANAWQTARWVIWPLAWPIMGAAAMFVSILSLSEVPATVLIYPRRPQVLIPTIMGWVHLQRDDAMIEASLLLTATVIFLGIIATLLGWIGLRVIQGKQKAAMAIVLPLLLSSLAFISGCGGSDKPKAIWCSTGVGPAQVIYPRAIAYSASDDSFFICDRQARIQHLDSNGKFIRDWHTPISEYGKPVGLTVGPDGNLYVPDTHYHRVLVYSPAGELLREWGSNGTDPGKFIYPTDIAFDSAGRIFVSEYGDNDRIQVFDKDANFIFQFGKFGDKPGEFSRPQSMVIHDDLLYLTDSCNHRIQVFKTDGTFVRVMGKVGSELGEFRFPYGLDIDGQGRLIVCEFGNNRVQLIDRETGKGIAAWGMAGREPGELAYPWGVAADKHGRVVAVDAGNNRLQVFDF